MKVLCIGNSTYDITIPVDKYPIENKKIKLTHSIIECGGGSCSNASCLLASWGVDTTIATVVGKDRYGESIKKEYERFGVNTKYLKEKEEKTSLSYIITNIKDTTRTILTSQNPNLTMDANTNIEENFDYILVDGGNFDFAKTILSQKIGVSILDAGSLNENTLELAKIADYVVCSNDFAKEYTGISFSNSNLDKMKEVYDILDNSFSGKVVITLENFGSFTKIKEEYKLIPSITVKSLDTTGAGDLYHGAFLYFLMKGYPLEKIMRLSNITGALSTRYIGGRNSIPSIDEVFEYDR